MGSSRASMALKLNYEVKVMHEAVVQIFILT